MNFTSGDLALVASLDYVTVSCRISYFPRYYWIPHPECLPIVIGEKEVTQKTYSTIWFTKTFNVTPDIDGVVVECVVKFNSTGYDTHYGIAHDAPRDVLLWKSTPLQVQCNHFLCFYYIHCFEYSVKITENFLHPVTQKISVKFTEPVNLIITEVFCKIVYFYFSVISVPLFKYCLVFVSGVARIWRYGGTGGLGQARRLPSPLSSPPLPSPPLPLPSP